VQNTNTDALTLKALLPVQKDRHQPTTACQVCYKPH